MSLFQLFIQAFKKPTDLVYGKDKSFWKIILYVLFLSLILCIPLAVQTIKVVGTIQDDMGKITEKMPEFTVEDNKLNPAKKDSGFIYQTDYMIFTFDPDGKRTDEDVQKDLMGNIIGVGMLQDKLVFAFSTDSLFASMLPNTIIPLPYSDFKEEAITKDSMLDIAQSKSQIGAFISASFAVGLLPILIDFLFRTFMVTTFGHFYSKMRRGTFSFSDHFKIVVFASTLPTFVTTFLNLIMPTINTSFIGVVLTMVIFTTIIKPQLPTIDDPNS